MNLIQTGNQVFTKSDKALEELASRCYGLGARQRQILILVDGKRDVNALRALFPSLDLEAVLGQLQKEGHIIAPDASGVGVANDMLGPAREYMIRVAQSCLGLLAADLVARIQNATRIAQLAFVAGYWITALRDSKYDGHLCEHYLEQLKVISPALFSSSLQAPAVD